MSDGLLSEYARGYEAGLRAAAEMCRVIAKSDYSSVVNAKHGSHDQLLFIVRGNRADDCADEILAGAGDE